MHGNNTKNFPVWLSLSQTSKNVVFFLFYVFSSTKSENKQVEQVLPGDGIVGEVAQIMDTQVRKCENKKIKFFKKSVSRIWGKKKTD
jgi:preprotein translocase subunit YajC